jgi:branched-chain amino acid transport system substrate-binding protein
VEYTGAILVAQTAPNYTAECLQVIDKGVEFVQLAVSAEAAARIVTDCQRQGYEEWWGASGGSVIPSFYDEVDGLRLAGGVNGFPWWVDSEPVQEFRDAMEEQGVGEETYGTPSATAIWATAELLRQALSAVTEDEDVTRATVQEGYGSLQGETLGGLLPQEYSFTPGQPAPPVNCYWLYQFEDGEFSGGDEPSCSES